MSATYCITDRLTGQFVDQRLTEPEAVRLTNLLNQTEQIQGNSQVVRYVMACEVLAALGSSGLPLLRGARPS